jgi:hypothetical protein
MDFCGHLFFQKMNRLSMHSPYTHELKVSMFQLSLMACKWCNHDFELEKFANLNSPYIQTTKL